MAMMTLEGVGGLGEPLTSFTDKIPAPMPIPLTQRLLVEPVQSVDLPRGSRTLAMAQEAAQRYMEQCMAQKAPGTYGDDRRKLALSGLGAYADNDLKAIDATLASAECQIEAYQQFPALGYPPAYLAQARAEYTKQRVAAVAAIAKEAAAVKAAADKIVTDEAKDKSAKDKLEVITTGSDTGKILGMDSKTFMLVAAAGLVLMMMEHKG